MASSTDGEQAGHANSRNIPDPPASTGSHGKEAARFIFASGRQQLLPLIRGMHRLERIDDWIETLDALDHDLNSVDEDTVRGWLEDRRDAIDAGRVSQPDDWAAAARDVREQHPEWDGTPDEDESDSETDDANPDPESDSDTDSDEKSAPTPTSGGIGSGARQVRAPSKTEASSFDDYQTTDGGADDEE